MDVKPGYKQTEVGVIPEDWEVRSIAQTAPLQRGTDLPVSELKPGPYPVVYSNGVMAYHEKAIVRGPGVVTGRSGTLGKVHYIESDYWPHNTSLWVTQFKGNDERFIYYLYSYIGFEIFSSGTGVPTLNRNDAHNFLLAFPPCKTEQTAIAEALSDADALIESLEQLIAKKRQIKQGAMQELLTGKRRLPGFEGEWEETSINDITTRIVGGGTPSRSVGKYWNGNVPWMTVKDITFHDGHHTLEYITEEGLRNSASNLIPKHTLITATRMAIGKAVLFEIDVTINQDMKAIFHKDDINKYFFYFWFQFNEKKIAELGNGSTVMGLSLIDLRTISFLKPSLAEQAAIAAILSDMDAEIAALEDKLAKAREIKQGMMQELLTGRIRLI